MSSLNQIVHLNVGGQRFSTTKATLLVSEDSFFTTLLSGRIPSIKDESGAYFIDRDPKLFSVLLTYMRTKELDLHGIDLIILRKEAEFYGLSSLSEKLALCLDGSSGVCGDLYFHGFVPYPDVDTDVSMFGSDRRFIADQKVTLLRCHYHFLAAVYTDRVALFKVKELSGWRLIWQSAPMPPQRLERLALRSMKVSLHSNTSTSHNATGATGNSTPSAATSLQPRERHTSIHLNSQGSVTTSSPATNAVSNSNTTSSGSVTIGGSAPSTSANSGLSTIPVPSSNTSSSSQNMVYLAVSTQDKVTLWLINASYNATIPSNPSNVPIPRLIHATSQFQLNGRHVDELFFVSDKLVALSKVGTIAVWRMTSNSWQISNLEPVCSYCATTQALFLGMQSGRIAYIDMDKFPVRLSDNDLLVNDLYHDPDGEPISALSVYITSKNPLMDCQRVEIAYGTPSGYTRLVAQLPNESGYGYSFYLIQTLDVHRSPIRHVSLSTRYLLSMCEAHNHVRTWQVNRFRGMMTGQPGAQSLASYAMPSIAFNALDEDNMLRDIYEQGNIPGPWGDQRDEPHVLLHKLLSECDQVIVRCASTGERIFTVRSASNSPISCFWVHEFNSDMRLGSANRRIIFTGHCDGSVQMWDLSTAIDRSSRPLGSTPAITATNAPAASTLPGTLLGSCNIAHPNPVGPEISASNLGTPFSSTSSDIVNYGEVRSMLRMLEGWNLRTSGLNNMSYISSNSLNNSRSSTLQRIQRNSRLNSRESSNNERDN